MDMDQFLLEKFSFFLQRHPDFISGEMLADFCRETQMDPDTGYLFLLCAALEIDPYGSETERHWAQRDIPRILERLDPADYARDPYLTQLRFPDARLGRWEFTHLAYKPYEAFVRDDFIYPALGRVLPQIGYFAEGFAYPAVLQDGREWMTVTPNEINTMAPVIEACHGRVLTFGLGMGYFAFHANRKDEVESLVIVEREEEVISLFREHLLPQFPHPERIRIVQADAFAYAQTQMAQENFDVVFTDLWHDPSDGVELYLRMKEMEKFAPGARFYYWIEKTLRYYL